MPAITRSMAAEITDAITLFAQLEEKPAAPDPDVAFKILFLAVLKRQSLFRQMFVEKPAFSTLMRDKCITVLKGAQRQDLRSVCRRTLSVFWPKPATHRDPITKARMKAQAEVEERASARAAELMEMTM